MVGTFCLQSCGVKQADISLVPGSKSRTYLFCLHHPLGYMYLSPAIYVEFSFFFIHRGFEICRTSFPIAIEKNGWLQRPRVLSNHDFGSMGVLRRPLRTHISNHALGRWCVIFLCPCSHSPTGDSSDFLPQVL